MATRAGSQRLTAAALACLAGSMAIARTWLLPAATVLAGACMLAAGVAAGEDDPGLERVQLTAAGQAFAKKVLLLKADFNGASGWTGGVLRNGAVPFPTRCPTYLKFAPRESD